MIVFRSSQKIIKLIGQYYFFFIYCLFYEHISFMKADVTIKMLSNIRMYGNFVTMYEKYQRRYLLPYINKYM